MTDEVGRGEYSAVSSALGYFYQVRYALLEALRRLRTGYGFNVSIETLDDVVFDSSADPLEIFQLKHHINKAANLTDASPDLWKTLRIRCEASAADRIPAGTVFILITTASAGQGHAAG